VNFITNLAAVVFVTLASDFMICDKKLNDDFSDGTLVILVIVVGKLIISDLGKFAKFRSWLIIDANLVTIFLIP
jgi:hypothetical protein